MDRRSNILEDVKEKGWQLSRELKLSTVEASIMVKQRQDNDVALNQLEVLYYLVFCNVSKTEMVCENVISNNS